MKGSWAKVISGFSQELAFLKKGTIKTDVIIRTLDSLLSAKNNLNDKTQTELKDLIIAANLPPELTSSLLSKFDDPKTHILQANNPLPQENPNTENSDGYHTNHSSSLLRDLLQWENNSQKKSIKPGQTIRNTYRLDTKIGSGGMGEVWKALDLIQDAGEAKDKNVAIKFIKHEIRSHPDILKALVREFARYKKLIHPNIVKAYELNRDNEDIFIAMEYLEGDTLEEFIRKHPKGISLTQAQPIIKGMCGALEYAHSEGIVHLDFKPGNVFYNPETQACKVIDFGIARLSSPTERDETRFDPGILGAITTSYASAEMLMGAEPDPRDDIYGLACVVYQLLSGSHPFNKNASLKAKNLEMKPKQVPGLSKAEFYALQHGLGFERDNRTVSAQQFYAELYLPQQLAIKKRTRWLIISSIIALAAVVIPTAIYKGHNSWQMNQVKTSIQQQLSSGMEGFLSLSIEEQKELLNDSNFRLVLVEFATTQTESDNDVLTLIDGFDSIVQQILFSDRNVREYLITYYSNRIDQAVKDDDFQLAEQFSLRILEKYPDSVRLVEESQSVKQKKELRLATVQQSYQLCLADNTKDLTELFPCLKQARLILAKIDNTNILLTSPRLTNRYHEEISFAIKNKKLTIAEKLMVNWRSLEQKETQLRTQLENELVYANKVSELIGQINESNNLQLAKILKLLSTLDPVLKKDILTNATVKHRLKLFYDESTSHHLDNDNFLAASQLISEGISLFSKSQNEQKYLKQLAKKVKLNKSKYLSNLVALYKKQLSLDEPDIQLIQNIQQNVSIVDSGNVLNQLPGLVESYSKKIEAAIVKNHYDLAQRLLDSWKALKPSASNTDVFIRLTEKRTKLLLNFNKRKKAALQLQIAIKSDQLIKIAQRIKDIRAQFSAIDQKKIISPNRDQIISVYQQHISAAVQKDAFDSAYKIISQLQGLLPKNKKTQLIKDEITQTKKTRINNLLNESRDSINTNIIEGSAIFSPLLIISDIDTEYLNKQTDIFQVLKQKLIMIASHEKALPQLKDVFHQWNEFLANPAHQTAENIELLRKTKNLIALRCLFNGRKLKIQNQPVKANELFMFGLSLDPITTVTNALEKELLQ